MTDDDLLALCVWSEAAGEPYEGEVAISRVVHNRMAAHFMSDGTVAGTVLHYPAFSGFWFAMHAGKYTRVAWTPADAEARAETMLADAKAQTATWARCQRAAADGAPGSAFAGGPQWQALAAEPRALDYANLRLCTPTWLPRVTQVAVIGHHTFFKE